MAARERRKKEAEERRKTKVAERKKEREANGTHQNAGGDGGEKPERSNHEKRNNKGKRYSKRNDKQSAGPSTSAPAAESKSKKQFNQAV